MLLLRTAVDGIEWRSTRYTVIRREKRTEKTRRCAIIQRKARKAAAMCVWRRSEEKGRKITVRHRCEFEYMHIN